MIEATGLKLLPRGPLEWYYLRTKFHENRSNGSEVTGGVQTDWLSHKPTFIFRK
jgi:hypothetical protein